MALLHSMASARDDPFPVTIFSKKVGSLLGSPSLIPKNFVTSRCSSIAM
eukprot:CAMPEP_0202866712 /NCGR_PEP_ID=MMETSP1391-20130828/8319_1 /ASSEMBLY_ACC=CAM_ASM_000867 /TAXON_ID=1034604 /ORGANISM="Chlamydomonas leiostraca, Strain SAG 11-49" /LENGTH=48 /DNA_ID= /DNA_START= /DNA_END= /DNA_ORIENTATION=